MTREFKFKFDFLFWFLILIPTFYIAGSETRSIQLEFFKIAVIAMVAFFHSNKYIGLFLGYLVFQFIFFKDMIGQSTVIPNIFFACLLYHFIVKYGKLSKNYLWAFYGILIMNVCWMALQAWNIDPLWSVIDKDKLPIMSEYAGWFALPAFLGNYAAAVLPFAFLLNPYLLPFALIALFYSKSSFSVLAALAGALFFLWFKKRIFFWITLLTLGTAGMFYIFKSDLPGGQPNRRFRVWSVILKEAFTRQFFGHGIGSYGTKYRLIEVSPFFNNGIVTNSKEFLDFLSTQAALKGDQDLVNLISTIPPEKFNITTELKLKKILESRGLNIGEWSQAHNEFIQLFFDLGLVGIFIIGAYIFDIFRRFYLYANTDISLALMSSFISILIISFAHFPFQIARLSGSFVSIMALLDLSLKPEAA